LALERDNKIFFGPPWDLSCAPLIYTILWLTIFMDCHYKKWRNSKKDVTDNPVLYRKFAFLLFFVEWMLSHLIDRIKKQKRLEFKVKTEFCLLNVTFIIFFQNVMFPWICLKKIVQNITTNSSLAMIQNSIM
jgi:hypothetical protein